LGKLEGDLVLSGYFICLLPFTVNDTWSLNRSINQARSRDVNGTPTYRKLLELGGSGIPVSRKTSKLHHKNAMHFFTFLHVYVLKMHFCYLLK